MIVKRPSLWHILATQNSAAQAPGFDSAGQAETVVAEE